MDKDDELDLTKLVPQYLTDDDDEEDDGNDGDADADDEETRCHRCYQAQNSFPPRTYSNVVTLLLVNKHNF